MRMKYLLHAFRLLILLVASFDIQAQEMTMDDAIAMARLGSVQAKEAKQSFISTYWAWRAYQASRLPSLSLYGNIGDFNRSLTLLQDPDDGHMMYVSTNNMQNSIGLKARQNIPITGGTLYLYSDLNRVDQLGRGKQVTWYSQPVTISYTQPLFGFNQFKWDKLIEPKEFERGKRAYIEAMEDITLGTVSAWFTLLVAREKRDLARINYINTSRMYKVAGERLKLGTVTMDEYLQLELRVLNDSLAINENEIVIREAQMRLNTLLGLDETSTEQDIKDAYKKIEESFFSIK